VVRDSNFMNSLLPPLVDSHCHLPLIERHLDDVLETASAQGVSHMLCVSVDLPSFPGVLALAHRYPHIFASVGVHPDSPVQADEPDVATLVALAADPHIVAIGETGLDYYRSSGDLSYQHRRFRTHIAAAVACGKPLIVHTREAAADTIRLLREEGAERIGGVMHCFVEDWATAAAAMDLRFYISFSGIVTFENATALQAVAREVPLERLLVETDAPWLAPVPKRGKPNEPAFVRHTAAFLAQLRGEDEADLARATTRNFFELFTSALPAQSFSGRT